MTGPEVRAMRLRYGLGQPEFAKLFGVSSVTVSRWETGQRPVPLWFSTVHPAVMAMHQMAIATNGRGRPPTAREAAKAEEAARLERERPIVCSVRFCEPGSGRPMDVLTFRPYYGIDEQLDPRAKVQTRWVVYEHEHEIPWRRTPAIPMEGWSEAGWEHCRDGLRAQLVAMGHAPEMALMYKLSAGADWSWHKVETSRPECIVTLAGTGTAFGGLTVVS